MKTTLSILALLGCIAMLNATATVPAACLSAFKAAALNQTNFYRARHGAAALTEDSTIGVTSQEWANYLSDNNKFEHNVAKLQTLGYGENIAMNYASGSPSTLTADSCARAAISCVNMWYDEVKDYNFQTGGFAMNTGHFTQLVWKSTTKVAHGVAFSANSQVILVANYKAPGNYQGQFQANVFPASSTAQTSTSSPSTAAPTTAASSTSTGKTTSVTTDAEAKTALAKAGTTLLLIWNKNCGIASAVKTSFDTFASQYTNLNFIAAEVNTYNGGNWAIMSSSVLKYSDYSVGGSCAPPTLVAYKGGLRSVAPVSLLRTTLNRTSETEKYVVSAGGYNGKW